jgi:hypothetical protein
VNATVCAAGHARAIQCTNPVLAMVCVLRQDIFEDGKPVVHGLVGQPKQMGWERIPASTSWFLGLPEVFRGAPADCT